VAATDAPVDDAGEHAARARPGVAAFAVVLVLGALAALLLVVLAFSADNTRQSVDGRTATTSGQLDRD
jgi:hypothetical protein